MKAIFSYLFFRSSDNGSLVPSISLLESLPVNTLRIPTRPLGGRLGALFFLAALVLLITACSGQHLGASDEGWSPVVAADGMVYVGTIQGQVLALDEEAMEMTEEDRKRKGRKIVKWVFPASEEDSIEGVYNSPVVGPDLVYVAALNGILYALSKDRGRAEGTGWSRVVSNDSEPAALVGGPVLSSDKNIVLIGSEDGSLYAYNAETGVPNSGFPFKTGGKIWSTPVVKDNVVYFGSHDRNIYAVNLNNGQEKWRWETGGAVVARPLLFKKLVVIGSFDKKLYALRANDGTPDPDWGGQAFADSEPFEGAGNWFWAGAVANESTIFAPAMDGWVYAIDAIDKKGELRWEQQLGSPIVSTPVLVDLGLIVAARNGEVKLLDLNNLGEQSGLPRLPSEVKAPLSAPPRIATPQPTPTPPLTLRRTPTPTPTVLANQGSSPVDQSDSVFIGTQDGIVYRLRVKRDEDLKPLWCFDTEEKKMLDNSECFVVKE